MWNRTVFYHVPRVLSVYSLNTAFHSYKDKDYYFSGEMHNFWELVCIKRGKALIAKDDKIYHLTEGDAVLHMPMEFHRIISDGTEFEIIVISFSSDSDVLFRLSDGVIKLDKTGVTELTELLDEIRTSFSMDGLLVHGCGNIAAAQMAVCRFERFLLSLLSESSGERAQLKTLSAKLFSSIIEMMNNNIEKNLSVAELALLCGMSESNLKKIIKKYTGSGVSKHFTMLKIVRATSMLESGMNVNEVSGQLGFSSPAYFSYVFKRETGIPPVSCKGQLL